MNRKIWRAAKVALLESKPMLTLSVPTNSETPQRVSVELQVDDSGRVVLLQLESYDAKLGWYPAGSLRLPIHQLPLLEQAIAEMRSEQNECQIIPFPMARPEQQSATGLGS